MKHRPHHSWGLPQKGEGRLTKLGMGSLAQSLATSGPSTSRLRPPSPDLGTKMQHSRCGHCLRLLPHGNLTCPRTAGRPQQTTRTQFRKLAPPLTTHPGSKPYRTAPQTYSVVRKPASLWHLALPARLTGGTCQPT